MQKTKEATDAAIEKEQRHLDGMYFRVKRGGKYMPIALTDLTDKERKEMLSRRSPEWLQSVVTHLIERIGALPEEILPILGIYVRLDFVRDANALWAALAPELYAAKPDDPESMQSLISAMADGLYNLGEAYGLRAAGEKE